MVAGSCDALVEIHGTRLMLDYKTSKAVYSDYGLQLAAYRNMEFIGLPDGSELPVPETDAGAVLHIREGKCVLYEVPSGPAEWEAFQACALLRRWDRSGVKPKEFAPRLSGLSLADAPALDLTAVLG